MKGDSGSEGNILDGTISCCVVANSSNTVPNRLVDVPSGRSSALDNTFSCESGGKNVGNGMSEHEIPFPAHRKQPNGPISHLVLACVHV
jgi:hypothetical protein